MHILPTVWATCPCTLVTVRKAEQTGALGILALAWTLFATASRPMSTPRRASICCATSIQASCNLHAWQRRTGRVVIEPATSRSASGSSTYEKVFPRGRLWLANANAELSAKTIKKGVKVMSYPNGKCWDKIT